MSFSYDPVLADDISKIRFLIQDTVDLGHSFEDEELQYLLVTEGTALSAATAAAFALYNKFAQELTVTEVGDVRTETKDRMKYYGLIYNKLKDLSTKEAMKTGFPVFIGGADRDAFIERSGGRTIEARTHNQVNSFFDSEY